MEIFLVNVLERREAEVQLRRTRYRGSSQNRPSTTFS
jgi:hypothetical protein